MGLWLFFHLIFFITSYWSLVSTFEGKADVKYNEEFPWNRYKKIFSYSPAIGLAELFCLLSYSSSGCIAFEVYHPISFTGHLKSLVLL